MNDPIPVPNPIAGPRPRGGCGGTSPLPDGMQWRPHTGRRQQMRELKRGWKRFEKECAKSDELNAARALILETVVDQVAPEQEETACYLVVQAARVRAEETGKRFVDLIHSALREMTATPRVAESWHGSPAS